MTNKTTLENKENLSKSPETQNKFIEEIKHPMELRLKKNNKYVITYKEEQLAKRKLIRLCKKLKKLKKIMNLTEKCRILPKKKIYKESKRIENSGNLPIMTQPMIDLNHYEEKKKEYLLKVPIPAPDQLQNHLSAALDRKSVV